MVFWIFALFNIRKITPFPTLHDTQLLVKAMLVFHIDYSNAHLTGLLIPAAQPLQMVQKAMKHLAFNYLKQAQIIPLVMELLWLAVAAHIKFKSLILSYRLPAGCVTSYLNNRV